MELTESQKILRDQIIEVLEEQGFQISSSIKPPGEDKTTFRNIHHQSKLETLYKNRDFLSDNLKIAEYYCRCGDAISPEKISLELREIKPGTPEETLFRWWNLVWWSIPFQNPIGRLMRFLLWDTYHDTPFGLFSLQSPVLQMAVRDKWLELPPEELNVWVNRSMNAHRIGALPPYNELLGGKMVAISITSNEVRESYKRKYENYITRVLQRKIDSELLFITTMSAFGKSSMYNRLKYKDEIVAECLGYSKGFGTFHIPDYLYKEIVKMLNDCGIDIRSTTQFGGIVKKLAVLSKGLSLLGLSKYKNHGIKREFYLFPLVKNLKEVIHKGEAPNWIDRPFNDITEYWKERWCIPRAERKPEWRRFNSYEYFKNIRKILNEQLYDTRMYKIEFEQNNISSNQLAMF